MEMLFVFLKPLIHLDLTVSLREVPQDYGPFDHVRDSIEGTFVKYLSNERIVVPIVARALDYLPLSKTSLSLPDLTRPTVHSIQY